MFCLVYAHDGSFENVIPLDILPFDWEASDILEYDHYVRTSCLTTLNNTSLLFNYWNINDDSDVNKDFAPKSYRRDV